MFRPPPGRQSSAKNPSVTKQTLARKLYETTEVQQMETDEDNGRQPTPRAKPGDKME